MEEIERLKKDVNDYSRFFDHWMETNEKLFNQWFHSFEGKELSETQNLRLKVKKLEQEKQALVDSMLLLVRQLNLKEKEKINYK
ncbi:hypothetical protein [Pedobacter immunditicola]|uniref:hypothetical protein n=1 Tax=Pedobacter immunditicola TaxID=3133440 RepID=UPI0030A397B5